MILTECWPQDSTANITVSLIFVDVLVVMDWFEDTELLPCTLEVIAVRLVMTVGAGLKWC